ncbi:unnamed protein product [Clavelina lepadiformis]|uniref:Phosphatidylglycerophosphatase and protein-tyrosine phosphatase 1 n=1 Tax=Clavelina lepadiformis TaxID=159417 RepID=A0ABP0F112_CLALP
MWSKVTKWSFYPTLVYNLFMEKVTSRQWYNRIDDTVILGALPFRSMSENLVQDERVKGVVSLNEDYELDRFVNSKEEWYALGVTQLRLPTVDLIAAPSQTNLKCGVDFIMEHRERLETVYVHCKAGRTRGPTLVACYLMVAYNWTPEKAIGDIINKRPHVWLRQAQIDSIKCFYKENLEPNIPRNPGTFV